MAMMLAPLSLNHPAGAPTASGGTGPFSGGVAQNILPWNWFNNFTGNRFSWFTVNLGRSSAPEVEAEILEEVGSYGRQLGRIGEVLEGAGQQAAARHPDGSRARRGRGFFLTDARDQAHQGAAEIAPVGAS